MVAYLPDGTRLLAGYVPSNVLSVIGLIVYGLLAFFGFLRSSSGRPGGGGGRGGLPPFSPCLVLLPTLP
jgi:hypothetical protein